jgi:hypothetical protein
MAQSAGLSVNETKQEMIVEAAIVTANWRKNSPEIPAIKAGGDEYRAERQRDGDERAADLVHGPPSGFRRRITDAQVAFDILDDDDGVVDHDADGEDQSEQRQVVE